ncbi:hypothetical protein N9D37_01190 [Erythrobacter sp.]|nr:hypothetical protein [Erythrobacter sp.]
MNGSVLALAIAGVFCFIAGAYLAATSNRTTGIALMSMGLIFQVLCLRQLKLNKAKDRSDAG